MAAAGAISVSGGFKLAATTAPFPTFSKALELAIGSLVEATALNQVRLAANTPFTVDWNFSTQTNLLFFYCVCTDNSNGALDYVTVTFTDAGGGNDLDVSEIFMGLAVTPGTPITSMTFVTADDGKTRNIRWAVGA